MKEQAVRIFQYLKELKKLSSRIVYDLSNYGYNPLWIENVPKTPQIKCTEYIENDDTGIWLEVKKQKLPKCISPSEQLIPWIKDGLYNEPDNAPILLEQIDLSDNQSNTKHIKDNPAILKEYKKYIDKQWKPWSDAYKAIEPIFNVYNQLFEIFNQIKKEGEKVEFILGIGLLVWNWNNQHIRKHLIVSSAQIDFDAINGVITIRAGTEGAKTQIEADVLQDILHRTDISKIENCISEANNPWDKEINEKELKKIVNILKNDGEYSSSLNYKLPFSNKPIIHWAPAFYLRKRGEQAWISSLNRIIEQIGSGQEVPCNIKAMIDSTREFTDNDYDGATTNVAEDDGTIYFPLLSNDSQKDIVNKIKKGPGILVQGPPGTGKSHTIANLICHYLALGKRILVTSQTQKALKVLKDKIPPSFQGLCVSVLGNDPESLKNLSEAVQTINDQYASFDKKAIEKEIIASRGSLIKLRGSIAEKEKELIRVSEKDYDKYTVGPYQGTILQISKALLEDKNKYEWAPQFDYVDNEALPATDHFNKYIEIIRLLTEDKLIELNKHFPHTSSIPTYEEFKRKVVEYNEANTIVESKGALLSHPLYCLIRRATEEQLSSSFDSLKILEEKLIIIGRIDEQEWIDKLKSDVLSENITEWKTLLDRLDKFFLANKHINDIAKLLESTISIPNNISSTKALMDMEDYVAYLTGKKSITLWDKYFTSEGRRFKYIMSKVLFNERNVNSIERAALLRDYLSINEAIKALDSIWGNMINLCNEPIIRKYYLYDNIRDILSKYLSLIPLLEDSRIKLGQIEPSLIPDWQNLNDINSMQELLILGRENIILDQLDTWFNQKEKYLADYIEHPDSHPISLDIKKQIKQKDHYNYRIALEDLSVLIKDKEDYNYFEKEYKAMKGNVLTFINYFKEHIKDADIDHKLSQWSNAWHYSRAKAFIDYFLVESNVADINKTIINNKQKELRLLESIGGKMAWHKCLSSMSQNEIQNLRAWAHAVKRIGKGTGKYAAKHRRDAQEAMNNCRTAIRAWIMPLFRVIESIQVMPNMFDVIIIDEASQSGPDALYLNYIAKQCIVVGDSEQIAPEAVGYDLQKIYDLINEFLFDIPFKERYEPQTSLYAHAEIRYGQRIILNEHFRCMPEIIHFSNDNFYEGRLICLKQYPPSRLKPIEAVYVKDGYREESSRINKIEAEMIVSKIVECCKDPNYKGKSMGVISLVGNEQANLIDQLLRGQLDAKEINERNLICGDAYSFQGDERDIMFLSMVVDINTHTIATDQKAARRINVAASRARDQSWLFHSIMPQDIGQGSYLHRLLKYYLYPGRVAPEEAISDYEDIFESPFEKDVFNAIKGKGYRVIPQYKYAGKRIDLVVVGLTSRIAVECDGDIYHGQERYEDDINRQRLLERCGWTFFRIRGGEYYKNPDKSLKPLWQLLKEYSIEAM